MVSTFPAIASSTAVAAPGINRGSGRDTEPDIEQLLARLNAIAPSTQEVTLRIAIDERDAVMDETEWRCWGSCDAAFGNAIRFLNRPYLEGYLRELGRRPRDSQGQIVYATQSANTVNWSWTERDPQPLTDC
ncbi:hypothetical protein [Pseudanabaena sp. FACHB-2040]|uniref:hypothetical protein n=1 Tax=Pseudanabaena sp. FACHB-2040 TaxID=2692859 RepID=UPI00168238F2|nr:hypothetical protein [Pseudanabaena sp. FACHB-2040]MBD2261384.1 hypothetical protein [Pseudanabaena sp. FACHB-2040]